MCHDDPRFSSPSWIFAALIESKIGLSEGHPTNTLKVKTMPFPISLEPSLLSCSHLYSTPQPAATKGRVVLDRFQLTSLLPLLRPTGTDVTRCYGQSPLPIPKARTQVSWARTTPLTDVKRCSGQDLYLGQVPRRDRERNLWPTLFLFSLTTDKLTGWLANPPPKCC